MNTNEDNLFKEYEETKKMHKDALFQRDKAIDILVKAQQDLALLQTKLDDIDYKMTKRDSLLQTKLDNKISKHIELFNKTIMDTFVEIQ